MPALVGEMSAGCWSLVRSAEGDAALVLQAAPGVQRGTESGCWL